MTTILIIRNHKCLCRCSLSEFKLNFTPSLLHNFYVIGCDEEDILSIADIDSFTKNQHFDSVPIIKEDVSDIPIVKFPNYKELEKALEQKRTTCVIINSKEAEEELNNEN